MNDEQIFTRCRCHINVTKDNQEPLKVSYYSHHIMVQSLINSDRVCKRSLQILDLGLLCLKKYGGGGMSAFMKISFVDHMLSLLKRTKPR